MKVTLLEFTGKGSSDETWRAADILIFTKNTRLTMSPGLLDEVRNYPIEKKLAELEYMANTIPSSWEMVDYIFLIEGVTRAFTHQFVRTRTNSYAQQTMRVLDVSEGMGWDYLTGPTIADDDVRQTRYDKFMAICNEEYKWQIANGAKIEDARGVLPTNILTNIVVKTSLRTFIETQQKRASPRTQGEYLNVMVEMHDEVLKVHPWASLFLDRTFVKAAADLDKEIQEISDPEKRIRMIKLVDQMRAK